jgi:hypothetical protein
MPDTQPGQITMRASQMASGISKQPPHERFPGQVEDAQNVVFSVVDGAGNRNGTTFHKNITGLTPGANLRLHKIERDASEQYWVIFGAGVLKVEGLDGNSATVTITAAAQKYLNLNGATADQLRLVTIADYTLIVNTTVPIGTSYSPNYTLTSSWRDYDVMTASTPVGAGGDNTYHHTTGDTAAHPAGYWKYTVGGITFATRSFQTVSGRENAQSYGMWDNTAGNPYGFKIGFQRYSLAIVAGTWTAATSTLTKTGAFASYTFAQNDQIFISGGTGWVAGWYTITSRVSNDAITITGGPGFDNADTTATGIGGLFTCSYNTTGVALADMYAVAAALQTALRADGASDALVAWTSTGYQQGYFTITSPYRGDQTTFFGPYPPGSGTDLTAAGMPFNGTLTGTAVNTIGTGTAGAANTLDVASRWTVAIAPNSPDNAIDPATMPVQMKRTIIGPPATFSVDVIAWNSRTSGDQITNPTPKLWQKVTSQGSYTNDNSSPTILTSANHGLSNGDTIAITGSTSVTTLDGNRVVSNVTTNTFTIPINTPGAGAGTWRKGGVPIADMALVQSRLVLAGAGIVDFSQTNDLFNFYLDDALNLVDSDPIDSQLPGDGVVNVDFLTAVRRTLLATTKDSKQFELNTPDALTPSTVGWTRTTSYQTLRVRPAVLGPIAYFTGFQADSSSVYEYYYDDAQASAQAGDITRHVRGLVPASLRTLATSPNNFSVFVLPTDGHEIEVYEFFYRGPQKVQSAWTRWIFDSTYRIADIGVIGNNLWMLVEADSRFGLEYLAISREATVTNWLFPVRLDRRFTLTGSYNAGSGLTTWTLPIQASGSTLTKIVLGPAFGANSGTTIPITGYAAPAGVTVTAAGDYSAGPCVLGRDFAVSLKLSRPYLRNEQGDAELEMVPLVRKMVLTHSNAGEYSVRVDYDDARADLTFPFTPNGVVDALGTFLCWPRGNVDHMSMYIESTGSKPVTISAVQLHADMARGLR